MFESRICPSSTFEHSKHKNIPHENLSRVIIKRIYHELPNNNCSLLRNVLQVFKSKFAFHSLKNQSTIINNH